MLRLDIYQLALKQFIITAFSPDQLHDKSREKEISGWLVFVLTTWLQQREMLEKQEIFEVIKRQKKWSGSIDSLLK